MYGGLTFPTPSHPSPPPTRKPNNPYTPLPPYYPPLTSPYISLPNSATHISHPLTSIAYKFPLPLHYPYLPTPFSSLSLSTFYSYFKIKSKSQEPIKLFHMPSNEKITHGIPRLDDMALLLTNEILSHGNILLVTLGI
jgi:hypothetical protein